MTINDLLRTLLADRPACAALGLAPPSTFRRRGCPAATLPAGHAPIAGVRFGA